MDPTSETNRPTDRPTRHTHTPVPPTEKDVQQWMESVLGEPFPEDLTFAQALKDGQVCTCVYKTVQRAVGFGLGYVDRVV